MEDEYLKSLAKDLNRFLTNSIIDNEGNIEWVMKKAFVGRIDDLIISVHPLDHPKRPHFHVNSPQERFIDARFDIETLELLPNSIISTKDYKKIIWYIRDSNSGVYEKLKEIVLRLYPKI